MPDPVSNAEIEDVLSSIRRLVTEEPNSARRRPPQIEAEAERLVLTPDQRVERPPEAERRSSEQQAWQPDPDDEPDLGGIADLAPSEDAAVSPKAENAGSLEDRAAGLEAALLQSGGEWEPDGSERGDTDLTRPLSADAGFNMAEAWSRGEGDKRGAEETGTKEDTAVAEDTAGPPAVQDPLAQIDEDTDLSELLDAALGPPGTIVPPARERGRAAEADEASPEAATDEKPPQAATEDKTHPDTDGAPTTEPLRVTPLRPDRLDARERLRPLPSPMAVDLSAVNALLSETGLRAVPTARSETPVDRPEAGATDGAAAGEDTSAAPPEEMPDAYRTLAARMVETVANRSGPVVPLRLSGEQEGIEAKGPETVAEDPAPVDPDIAGDAPEADASAEGAEETVADTGVRSDDEPAGQGAVTDRDEAAAETPEPEADEIDGDSDARAVLALVDEDPAEDHEAGAAADLEQTIAEDGEAPSEELADAAIKGIDSDSDARAKLALAGEDPAEDYEAGADFDADRAVAKDEDEDGSSAGDPDTARVTAGDETATTAEPWQDDWTAEALPETETPAPSDMTGALPEEIHNDSDARAAMALAEEDPAEDYEAGAAGELDEAVETEAAPAAEEDAANATAGAEADLVALDGTEPDGTGTLPADETQDIEDLAALDGGSATDAGSHGEDEDADTPDRGHGEGVTDALDDLADEVADTAVSAAMEEVDLTSDDGTFTPAAAASADAWEDWDASEAATPDPATIDLIGADEALLDEDALREMVAQLVREELQGALGERITRNVRRLVRREIEKALAMRDLT